MSGPANRGKYAESKVKSHLQALKDRHSHVDMERIPDAHAAGGRFTPQAGDFAAYISGRYVGRNWEALPPSDDSHLPGPRVFVIEVKELKHDFRLPHSSYSADKVARVQRRVWAGAHAIVICYHSVAKQWRAVPFSVFTDRSVGGSWDLRGYPLVDYKAALNEFIGLCP